MEKIGSTRPAIRLVLENFRRPRQSWTRAGGPDVSVGGQRTQGVCTHERVRVHVYPVRLCMCA